MSVFLLCIVLMVTDNYGHFLSSFRSVLLTALAPVEQAASMPMHLYNWLHQDFANINRLEKEVQRLKTENLLLKTNQLKLNSLEQEIANLNALLGTASKTTLTRLPTIATVNYYSNSPYSQFIKINKGSLHQVLPNQAVIDEDGVVGQVIHTTPTSSRVQLITDPDNHVPVRIQRTGQRGILVGLGNNLLSLKFIPNASSIQEGDLLVTSGLGELYPAGYPVATITTFAKKLDQPYYQIEAVPASQLKKSNKVLILSDTTTRPGYE